MRAQLICSLLASVVLALVGPGVAQAQDDTVQRAVQDSSPTLIGRVVSVTGSASIDHPKAVVVQASTSDQAKVGDLVYLGDVVRTEANGRIAINFTDGTSFNLASNARMVMTEFVYDPNGTQNSSLLSLTKGTFTFVAGNIAKTGDMKIDTPVATMGIRGTTPHIEISDDGTVKFATLIEEGKSSKLMRKPGKRAAMQPWQLVAHRYNPDVCRGC
ncbi:FecR domain-containing protein [Bradyrhizobium tropiciagri]|uniref:FecR family protein n=1 Tax=Bradyrhizobium tropiciagri TaxID=312253 RepID=UPI001BA7884E|nr:FecR family protein [Bradyrhizobium tropiciagri]MBR0869062.1 FecR domain-containing protein [Bradyrhizobium tropiciagri]